MTKPINRDTLVQQGTYNGYTLEGIAPQTALALYRAMVRLRSCEETLMAEYRKASEMKCPIHFVVGQEAVSSALSLLLKPEDHMFSHHRSHGYYLAKGGPLPEFFAELFGKSTGVNGGFAGSQEISHPEKNFHSGAILTGASSIAAGVAFAFQLNRQPHLAVAGFGEAATEEGAFWEAISYASLRRLPLVYICENNMYATFSHQMARQPLDNIHERVASFGVRSEAHFGNDAVLAHKVLQNAFEHARSGQGPCFIEFYTYRWTGHVGPEPDDEVGYRVPGVIDYWRKHCPIAHLEKLLIEAKLLDAATKAKMIGEIETEISSALTFARNSPFPAPDAYLDKNLSLSSPVADRLLKEGDFESFDGYQPDALLAPY